MVRGEGRDKNEPHKARGRCCMAGTMPTNPQAPQGELVPPELETRPWDGLWPSCPLQRPSPHAGWGGLWRQERLTRKGEGWQQAVLHPPSSLRKKPTAEQGQIPEGVGVGMGAPVTHHCRNPSWAWLAWRPRWSLKRGKVSGLKRMSSNKASGRCRGPTAGTSPNLHPKSSFPLGVALELLLEDLGWPLPKGPPSSFHICS